MQRTLTTPSGLEVQLASSAAFLYVYKNQFGREPLKDIMSMNKNLEDAGGESEQIMENLDLEVLHNLTWALAKCADPSIGLPMTFYLERPDFLPMDHMDDILEMALASFSSSVQPVDHKSKNVVSMPKK